MKTQRASLARPLAIAGLALAAVASAAPPASAPVSQPAALGQGPGWTGITRPKDVIAARQELMEHIELLMEPIDTIQVKPVRDVQRLHEHAEAISAMLRAVPHLFPPTTNRYDPKAATPQTLALAPIWQRFDDFYGLADAAARAADAMAAAKGTQPLRAASRALRGSCDACHALYLRKYEPPKVLESDYRFDFDSALRKP